MRIYDRKISRKIFDPVVVKDIFGMRINKHLYKLLKDMDVFKRINNQRLHIEESVLARQVYDVRNRRPCLR